MSSTIEPTGPEPLGPEGSTKRLSRAEAKRQAERVKTRFESSSAGSMWGRLTAMDFINQAMMFAAILLLAFLPFTIVVSSLAGRDVATGLARHLGLNHHATSLVMGLFNTSSKTSAALTVRGLIFAIFGGIGTAATLQGIYERLYGLQSRGMKDVHRQLIWIASVLGGATLVGWISPQLRSVSGGPIALAVVAFVVATGFWLFTIWILVSHRVPWHNLVPPAVATALCWIGLGVFSKFFFSNTIIGDSREYGQIGVVFALMSWLIAIGVVIILGAVVGIVWFERDLSFRGAFVRVAQRRRPAHRPEEQREETPAPERTDEPTRPPTLDARAGEAQHED